MRTRPSQFSQGWTALCDNTHSADLTPSTLLSINQEQYSQWLHRTAQKIVYWTAVQPDTLYTQNTDYYTYHANIDQQLSTILYTNARATFSNNMKIFISPQNKQNLGGENNNFPLFSLMKGLTRFSAHIVLAVNTYEL